MRENRRRLTVRLVCAATLAVGGVVGSALVVPSYSGPGAGESKALLRAYDRATSARTAATEEEPSSSVPGAGTDDGHGHDHGDPATKNLLSRGGEAQDPTTPAQAMRGLATVEAQRAEPDPTLTEVPAEPRRHAIPQDRYAMAGGCYALRSPDGRWVRRDGDGYAATAADRSAAEPFHFQATTLGKYLLFDSREEFLSTRGTPVASAVVAAGDPAPSSVWTVRRPGGGFTFAQDDQRLRAEPALVTGPRGDRFALRRTSGCAEWPDIDTNISGRTFAGISPWQEVRGTIDAHTHGMAFEFLGGKAHCGRPWSPYGVTAALVDCPDHEGEGAGAALENLTRYGSPVGTHDPVGWPTFEDWPAPDSLTHEGTYFRWMERAHQGGLRLFVNLLVENNQLCRLYPLKSKEAAETNCDEMASVLRQAKGMRQLERYVDAQHGGPGKGWYRIVTNPFQARKVINQGKLAVVMGIETSVPFGCSLLAAGQPECSAEQIDRWLTRVHKLGVRQMELVNKFDNALAGIAGDTGQTGVLVNGANFLETGSFWKMETCPESAEEGVHDREQYHSPEGGEAFSRRDGLFAAVGELFGVDMPAAPLYGPAPHCNNRDLTQLGRKTIRGMVQRNMIFDPDHMSVKARRSSLDLLEKLGYSGVISSHSWATPDAYPRIYQLGGFITPYAGDSDGFVEKWRQHLRWADPRYYFGFGYGADINGLGAQGDPRGADAPNPVTYPFEGWGGVTVHQQVSGERVYDINVDGVAHYGLYPDWLEDLERQAGADITTDMQRGAEAYLQMWERAVGLTNDACRQPSLASPVAEVRDLRIGSRVTAVLRRIGQPHARLDRTYTYCAEKPNGVLTEVDVVFDAAGRLLRVR